MRLSANSCSDKCLSVVRQNSSMHFLQEFACALQYSTRTNFETSITQVRRSKIGCIRIENISTSKVSNSPQITAQGEHSLIGIFHIHVLKKPKFL